MACLGLGPVMVRRIWAKELERQLQCQSSKFTKPTTKFIKPKLKNMQQTPVTNRN